MREFFNLQRGLRYTSIPFTTTGLVAGTPVNIFSGFGYGFIILFADDAPHTNTLKARFVGVGKEGNDYIYLTPNVWYDGPFQGLQIEANTQLPVGVADEGNWICNIAMKSDARAFPSTPPIGFNGFPGVSGGAPVLNQGVLTTLAVAGVIPTLPTDGLAFGAITQLESMFQVFAQSITPAETIVSGGIDIYKYIPALLTANGGNGTGWACVAQNILLPIDGTEAAGIVFDVVGPRQIGDRIYATPSIGNPIVLSAATATVNLLLRLQ